MMGAIAGVLLLAGGLTALQQAAILGSVPFVFILIGIVWSWVKAMRSEFPSERRRTRAGASSPDVVAQPMP
jgi:choline-glycine betaine transporter